MASTIGVPPPTGVAVTAYPVTLGLSSAQVRSTSPATLSVAAKSVGTSGVVSGVVAWAVANGESRPAVGPTARTR